MQNQSIIDNIFILSKESEKLTEQFLQTQSITIVSILSILVVLSRITLSESKRSKSCATTRKKLRSTIK